jgi:hypothetical protein
MGISSVSNPVLMMEEKKVGIVNFCLLSLFMMLGNRDHPVCR